MDLSGIRKDTHASEFLLLMSSCCTIQKDVVVNLEGHPSDCPGAELRGLSWLCPSGQEKLAVPKKELPRRMFEKGTAIGDSRFAMFTKNPEAE